MKALYAYYSKQAVASGYHEHVFRTRDGREVVATAAMENLAAVRGYLWEDKVFVAVVHEYVRQHRGAADSA